MIPKNKRHLIVNKEYSRLPYWTDEGYEDVQRQVSQKYVQDSFGKFAESENQQSYKEDAGYDDGYQGLEYKYTPFGMDNMPNINDLGKYPPANPQGLIVIICFCKTCICYDPFIAKKLDWICTNGQHGVFNLTSESQLTFDAPSMYDAGAPSVINRCDICDDCSGDPCKSALISPTSLTITAGASQTLTVASPESGTKYKWSTTTGTVSPVQGQSVIFTAPSTNANCANNATVTLRAEKDGVIIACDTLTIAVNAYALTTIAYGTRVNDYCTADTTTDPPYTIYTANVIENAYQCDGTQPPAGYLSCVNASGTAACNTRYGGSCSCAWCYANAGPVFGTCPSMSVGLNDLRTPAMKAAGCCPSALI